jgi:hypothetical protein
VPASLIATITPNRKTEIGTRSSTGIIYPLNLLRYISKKTARRMLKLQTSANKYSGITFSTQ